MILNNLGPVATTLSSSSIKDRDGNTVCTVYAYFWTNLCMFLFYESSFILKLVVYAQNSFPLTVTINELRHVPKIEKINVMNKK